MGCSLCCCGKTVADSAAGRRELVNDSNTVSSSQHSVFRNVDEGYLRMDDYVPSARGNYMLFTRVYLPCANRDIERPSQWPATSDDSEANVAESDTVKGLICFALGWDGIVDYMAEETILPLVQKGFVVFTMDHFGHGRSDGLWMSPRMDQVVDDERHGFAQMREKLNDPFSSVRLQLAFSAQMTTPKAFDENNCFLMGFSMGGGICVDISLKEASLWRAMVLVAPMITLHEDVTPPKCVIGCGSLCVPLCPDKQWTPGHDLIDAAFQSQSERERVRANPLHYTQKVRLGTALSILQFTQRVDSLLSHVSLPFYVLHGNDDTVTDPKSSENLLELAAVSDKTLKKYDNAWHAVFYDPNAKDVIYEDITEWIQDKLDENKGAEKGAE